MSVHQIGVHEAYDDVGSLRLTAKRVQEPLLDVLVEPEAAGNGKHNRQDGHDGQHGGVSECRCCCHDVLVDEEAHSQIQLLERLDEQMAHTLIGFGRYSPDVSRQVSQYVVKSAQFSVLNFQFSIFNFQFEKERSAPVSRVLSLQDLSVRQVPVIYLVRKLPCGSSVLPSIVSHEGSSGGQPSVDGIRELAAPSRHSPTIARRLVVSYTAFSPLPRTPRGKYRMAVIFFCLHLRSPTACIFTSGVSCAARTFLSHHQGCQRQSRNTAFSLQSYEKSSAEQKKLASFLCRDEVTSRF